MKPVVFLSCASNRFHLTIREILAVIPGEMVNAVVSDSSVGLVESESATDTSHHGCFVSPPRVTVTWSVLAITDWQEAHSGSWESRGAPRVCTTIDAAVQRHSLAGSSGLLLSLVAPLCGSGCTLASADSSSANSCAGTRGPSRKLLDCQCPRLWGGTGAESVPSLPGLGLR